MLPGRSLLAFAALLFALPCLADNPAKEKKPESAVDFDEGTETQESVTRLAALAKKGDAEGAAAAVAKVLRAHADQVVDSGEGTFLPAWRVLARSLQALPAEFGQAYVRANAQPAAQALADAHDLLARARVVKEYLAALPAEEVLRVATAFEEDDRPLVAEAFLEETLARRNLDRAVAARATLALCASCLRRGDAAAALRLRKATDAAALATRLDVGGRSLPLSEAMDAQLHAVLAPPGPGAPSGPGTSRPASFREPADAPAWTKDVPVLGELERDAAREQEREKKKNDPRHIVRAFTSGGVYAGYVPLAEVLGADRLVVHLGKSLFVYRIEDGSTDWTLGGERNLSNYLSAAVASGAPACPAAVTDGTRLFATVAGKARPVNLLRPVGRQAGDGPPRIDLVCHRLSGGKLVWELTDEEGGGKDLSYVGQPCLLEGRLYVAALDAEHAEKMSVVCLTAADGKLVWRKFLSSCPAPTDQMGGYPATPSPMCAVDGGTLYVCTGTGAFAALDPATGEFLWGVKYGGAMPTDPQAAMAWRWQQGRVPHRCAPTLVTGQEGVWIAPGDEHRFYLVDTATRGIRLKRRMDDVERYRFLVGHVPEGVVLGGPELGVYSAKENLLRHWELPRGEGVWRPALCDGVLLVPSRAELVGLDVATFEPRWRVPLKPGQAGDVLPCARGVALVSTETISFFPWKP